MLEIIITAAIAGFAIYILVKNVKKKASGEGCNCGSCSSHCPVYKDKEGR
ncbi:MULTISPECIES: FeoB-associated Cys-rich membrane protein [Clostridium]|uniref:Virus attachment protein p12 family protein n=1 Tax=Clostridium thermopalmarium DSM 5974 TaxID=1121340 RepID=A0A2T0ALR1_9CLOT|nr:FeoB-associated Cys-rich membrane protein [Clostridium thermopalmarium]MBE6044404.1 FeoB-associated Cys-rich membrane protein [Clostridium thermopalmarium]PRR69491.1 Virus attachment protein p12 family protein [Clostridium thermopalmarium DSM 5974]PVZ26243.1 ferrous iron transport protein B [Clostridium thermopalmarium DSM 5974]